MSDERTAVEAAQRLAVIARHAKSFGELARECHGVLPCGGNYLKMETKVENGDPEAEWQVTFTIRYPVGSWNS